MIPIRDALESILSAVKPMPTEMLPITEALGRILAEPVCAPRDLPPQDNSAMDGYAFRREDSPESGTGGFQLAVVDEIGAGHASGHQLKSGEAIKIMTGAPVPEGADTVVPVEQTSPLDGRVEILKAPDKGANIRLMGEDVREGEQVVNEGARVRPAEVGMLASMGRSYVCVRQRPRVAILATGDEIVEIDTPALGGKIINSNSYGMAAQVLEAGGVPVMLGIGRDDPDGLLEKLAEAEGADMVLTTGGVSMGDYDYVREVLDRWGVEVVFWRVAMKPGKPVLYGRKGRVPVFGLPGNPVSAHVSFEQFVRPTLRKLSGAKRLFRPVIRAVIDDSAGAVKAKAGRTEFVRCRVIRDGTAYRVVSVKRRGSGMLSTLVEANGLLILPSESSGARPGDEVSVQIYDYEFMEGREPGW